MDGRWPDGLPVDLTRDRSVTERQTQILADLEALFLREGFRNLTVQELARRLRCSRRTLYDLAPSKNDLVLLVVDRLLRRIGREAMARMRQQGDPLRRLHAYLSAASSALSRGGDAFFADVAAHAGTRQLFHQHYRFAKTVCATLIEEGIADGRFRPIDPRIAAEFLYAGLNRLQEPDVVGMTGRTVAEALDQVFELIMFGLSIDHRPLKPTPAG